MGVACKLAGCALDHHKIFVACRVSGLVVVTWVATYIFLLGRSNVQTVSLDVAVMHVVHLMLAAALESGEMMQLVSTAAL